MLAGRMGELLALQGVGKSYRRGGRGLRVLADASLEVACGEVGAVVGSRDEGKTTLLKIAAGIEQPDTGEVWLGDLNLGALLDGDRSRLLGSEIAWTNREGTGVKLEVLDYLALPLAMGRGRGRREAQSLARTALERVGAAGCAQRRWSELSDWERVLVWFARGFVCSPRLMVLDSVIDGLGMRRTREAGELLLALTAELRVRGAVELHRPRGSAVRRPRVVAGERTVERALRAAPRPGGDHRFSEAGPGGWIGPPSIRAPTLYVDSAVWTPPFEAPVVQARRSRRARRSPRIPTAGLPPAHSVPLLSWYDDNCLSVRRIGTVQEEVRRPQDLISSYDDGTTP